MDQVGSSDRKSLIKIKNILPKKGILFIWTWCFEWENCFITHLSDFFSYLFFQRLLGYHNDAIKFNKILY